MTLQTPELLDSKTYGFEKLRYLLQSLDAQEGVVDPGDLKVTQNGTPNMTANVAAGRCFVQADTGTRNGLYHCVNDATVNVPFTASHATLPRIDMLVLTINDSSDLGSASDVPVLSVVPGTATSGATLDNRLGAATLPPNSILLADILIPAAATTVTTANIRDRRLWTRGSFVRQTKANANVTNATSTMAAIDTATLQARLECSGAPVRATLQAFGNNGTGGNGANTGLQVDGVGVDSSTALGGMVSPVAGNAYNAGFTWVTVPVAGSHVFTPTFSNTGAGTATLIGSAAQPMLFTLEELVRQNANNT